MFANMKICFFAKKRTASFLPASFYFYLSFILSQGVFNPKPNSQIKIKIKRSTVS